MPGVNDWRTQRRAPVRSAPNPIDKSTIVSIYPKEILEVKHTLFPGRFIIPAGSVDNPSILIVGTSGWFKEVDTDLNSPLLEITVGSMQLANSIITDYANGLMECNMGDAMPGLFFVPGCKFSADGSPDNNLTLAWIKKDHAKLLDVAKQRQINYYTALVKRGDTLWARSNGNPMSICEDMRLAAKELGLDRPWMNNAEAPTLDKCPACGSMANLNYPICQTCKTIINPEKFKSLGLKQAV